MKRVRQRRTAAEEKVALVLRELGLRYRRNDRSLPGSPDFANKKRGWAIFVMGCFWHKHTNCPRATVPKRNHDYWEAKFQENRKRDAAKIKTLRALGLKVLLLWECEIDRDVVGCLEKIRAVLDRRKAARARTATARD